MKVAMSAAAAVIVIVSGAAVAVSTSMPANTSRQSVPKPAACDLSGPAVGVSCAGRLESSTSESTGVAQSTTAVSARALSSDSAGREWSEAELAQIDDLMGDGAVSRKEAEAMVAQGPFSYYKDQIAGLTVDRGIPGFADSRLDVAGSKIYIYWQGAPPTEAAPIVKAAAAQGIEIIFEQARYSEDQHDELLQAAAKAISDADGQIADAINLISIKDDGVHIAGPGASTDPKIQQEIRAIIKEALDLPVIFEPDRPVPDFPSFGAK